MKIFLEQSIMRNLSEHYASLKGMWEEFNVYQLLITNIEVQRRRWEESHVAKFLSLILYMLKTNID